MHVPGVRLVSAHSLAKRLTRVTALRVSSLSDSSDYFGQLLSTSWLAAGQLTRYY